MKLASIKDRKRLRLHAFRLRKSIGRILSAPVSSTPVFVFGPNRSGTTMLMYLLHMHRMTEVYDEAESSRVFRKTRIRSFEAVQEAVDRSRAPFVCFKPICDSHLIREFIDRFPAGKHVWIHRNYKDVANSAIRQFAHSDRALRIVCSGGTGGGWFQEGISTEMLRVLREVYRPDLSAFECSCLVWWARNRVVIEEGLAEEPNVYLLAYEDMVTHVEEETRGMLDFIGLSYEKQVAAHVHSRSIRRHDYPPLDPTIESVCEELSKTLERLGRENRSRHDPMLIRA